MIQFTKRFDSIVAHIKRGQVLQTGKALKRRNLIVTNPQMFQSQSNILQLFDFLDLVPSEAQSLQFGHTSETSHSIDCIRTEG